MDVVSRIFLIVSVVSTVLGYTIVFGDSGLLVQHELRTQLENIKENIEELKDENLVLNERYQMLEDDARALNITARQYYFLSPETTIIKIDELTEELKTEGDPVRSSLPDLREKMSIQEARALFFVFMVFFTVCGLYAINSLRRRRLFVSPSSEADAPEHVEGAPESA